VVIAADNDRAMEGQEVGRNPGLIKGQQAASANGAVLMAPSFSEEELEAGFSDWNDLVQLFGNTMTYFKSLIGDGI